MSQKLQINRILFLFLLGIICSFTLNAQEKGIVKGGVMDGGEPLIGATVVVGNTTTGTITDFDGNYQLSLEAGTYNINVSYIGYSDQSREVTVDEGRTVTLNFNLEEGLEMEEVIVLGTRASNRTNVSSPVPVDVINVGKITAAAPQTSLNQIMHYAAPSFSSNTQTISDGTDHIDPASLRGLGPDQVLVLINGKRRHTSSLVNVNGTFGRGNVGTDLNAIPSTAVKNIEVLRDGAAAQYGSDAIAGVINTQLKDNVNELSVNFTTGANFSSEIGAFGGEVNDYDGEVINLGVNYGVPLTKNGGFINLTGEFNYRGATSRMKEFSGSIFNVVNSIERELGADEVANMTADELGTYMSGQNNAAGVIYNGELNEEEAAAIADGANETIIRLGRNTTDSELAARGMERSDFNMRVGQSELRGGQFFANMAIPLSNGFKFYSFGGVGYRNGTSGCFYRLPNQSRTTTAIYENGTVPLINSNITDKSIAMGIKGKAGNWDVDLSNVFGKNQFLYNITNTHNATLGVSSPTSFDAGGHAFTQNTGNLDVSQYFDMSSINGINVAFGAEYRYENYEVIPGSVESFGNYDVNGNLVTPTTPSELLTTDVLGRSRPSGAQCFAGFLPFNEVNANRSSVAGYLDTEFDITDRLLLSAAVRMENYSDFGSTFNYKVAGRFKINNNLNVRASHSTGFRAPSLHQIHFSRTSTVFELVNGVSIAQEQGTFANDSRAAKLLGIPELKEETSQSIAAGVTAKIPSANLKITLDAYQVNIDDRVILTGSFKPGDALPEAQEELESIFAQAGATGATFFSNAIDTRSQGIDAVVSHSLSLGSGKTLRNDLAATFSKTVWDKDGGINSSQLLKDAGLEDVYFDQTSRIYLEQAVPRTKITLSNTLTINKLSIYLRNTYFGETTEATSADIFDEDLELTDSSIDPYYAGKVITDLSIGYELNSDVRITVGANNLLDVYPDVADPTFQSSGRFVYSRRSPQFSFGGRHLFARVLLNLK